MENPMTKLPEKNLLSGSKKPHTTTGEMKDALGKLHDYLNELFGYDSTDKEAARHSLGIDLSGLNARIDKKPDSLSVENAISETLETIMTRVDVIKNELKNEIAKNGVPTGTIAFFAMSAPPAGYLKADGAIIQRTDYPALFTAIGTTFGEGDGTTTFTLPDLRGEFIRGWDNGRNIDCERAFGSIQGDAIRNVTGQLRYAGPQNSDSVMNYQSALQWTSVSQKSPYSAQSSQGSNYYEINFDASRSVPTASENRPRNIALLACIKY